MVIVIILATSIIVADARLNFYYKDSSGLSSNFYHGMNNGTWTLKQYTRKCMSVSTCITWAVSEENFCLRSDGKSVEKSIPNPPNLTEIFIITNRGGRREVIKKSLPPKIMQQTGVYVEGHISSFVYSDMTNMLLWSDSRNIYLHLVGQAGPARVLVKERSSFMQTHRNRLYFIPGRASDRSKKTIKVLDLSAAGRANPHIWYVSETSNHGLVVEGENMYWVQQNERSVILSALLPSNVTTALYSLLLGSAFRLSVQDVSPHVTMFAWINEVYGESSELHIRVNLNTENDRVELCRGKAVIGPDTRSFMLEYPFIYYSTYGTSGLESMKVFTNCSFESSKHLIVYSPDDSKHKMCVFFDVHTLNAKKQLPSD